MMDGDAMTRITRRGTLGSLLTGAVAAAGGGASAQPAPAATAAPAPGWAKGIEGQRKADLGNGTYLNPIMAGDHPDPTILKDGADYYMTFSSFDAYPGVVIWHSKDLVNWRPVGATLRRNIGSVWACDLCRHQGRYYIYIPVKKPNANSIHVIWADHIEGPWSEPVDLKLPNHIDPGHIVDETGARWLFLSGGDRVRLSPDGLATVGKVEHVYDPWHYPEEWDVEGF
jgi:beta-xylosidase